MFLLFLKNCVYGIFCHVLDENITYAVFCAWVLVWLMIIRALSYNGIIRLVCKFKFEKRIPSAKSYCNSGTYLKKKPKFMLDEVQPYIGENDPIYLK